jgi:hypothetical protein
MRPLWGGPALGPLMNRRAIISIELDWYWSSPTLTGG